jgi:hypothetical protein
MRNVRNGKCEKYWKMKSQSSTLIGVKLLFIENLVAREEEKVFSVEFLDGASFAAILLPSDYQKSIGIFLSTLKLA